MVDKTITGLFNGMVKRDYYGDTDISNEFLKEQLFPDISDEEFNTVFTQYANILKNMIYSDMDFNQLEAFLTSLVCKKQNNITEEQKAAIIKFWKGNKQKLHSVLINNSSFNNSLQSFKWRIDVDYKDGTHSSEPKVIFELGLDKRDKDDRAHEKIMFQSDSETLDELIKQTGKIEEIILNATK